MGLFPFSIKKNAPAEIPLKCSELRLQIKHELISTSTDGLLRKNVYNTTATAPGIERLEPNKYGNFLLPPRSKFVVHGKNQKTGRMNKKEYEATDADDAERQAEQSGLTPPFEVKCEKAEPATEGQTEYISSFGVYLPHGASKEDASFFIQRVLDGDEEPAPTDLLDELVKHGWTGSALIGLNAAQKQAKELGIKLNGGNRHGR